MVDEAFAERLPCGHVIDDASTPTVGEACAREGGPQPDEGAVAVCFYCGALGVFTGVGFAVRLPTDAERAALLADPKIVDLVGSILAYRGAP